jgi:hypothetical protein
MSSSFETLDERLYHRAGKADTLRAAQHQAAGVREKIACFERHQLNPNVIAGVRETLAKVEAEIAALKGDIAAGR